MVWGLLTLVSLWLFLCLETSIGNKVQTGSNYWRVKMYWIKNFTVHQFLAIILTEHQLSWRKKRKIEIASIWFLSWEPTAKSFQLVYRIIHPDLIPMIYQLLCCTLIPKDVITKCVPCNQGKTAAKASFQRPENWKHLWLLKCLFKSTGPTQSDLCGYQLLKAAHQTPLIPWKFGLPREQTLGYLPNAALSLKLS